MRLSEWGPISLAVLTVAGLISGCGPAPAAELLFADFVPFGQGGVSTDIVLPPTGGTDPLLSAGWAPWSEESVGRGLWVYGHDAQFRFFAAVDGNLMLEIDAEPFRLPGAPSQNLAVALNGEAILELPLEPARRTYQIQLPGSVVVEGWNQIRMKFLHALRPSDFVDGSRDNRLLAARFHRISVRSELNRPLWPDRPTEVRVSNVGESRTSAIIEMPTDSVMDVLIEPLEGQQLVGSVDISLVNPAASVEVRTTVELLDSAGDTRELFSESFDSEPRSPATLQADLSEWKGERILVRVRSWGNSNALVNWSGLGLSAVAEQEDRSPADATEGRLLRPVGQGGRAQPDIIIIMLDAARADAFLGPEHSPSTPNIDALASEATHFTAAWAPSAWTGQGVPGILTGYYPDAVGAEVWGSQLPAGIPTLAELLVADGYFTALWSQHRLYSSSPSLQRGFSKFDQVNGSRVVKERELLPSADFLFVDDKPTFALIHLLPPHDPYEPPQPFRGRLTEWYVGDLDFDSTDLNVLQFDMPAEEVERSEIIRYAHDRYLENVEFADHLVGRLIQVLKDSGRYDDALIIVLADHGEAFFEHERFLHTVQLYEESVRVPFFLKWPSYVSGFARQVAQPVTLLDLAPTLTEGLRVGGQVAPFHGKSLIPVALDDITYDRGLYAYTRGNRRAEEAAAPVFAYRSGRYKIIYRPLHDILQLFDLQQDPHEEHDLVADDPLHARFLLQQAMLQKKENLALLARSGPQEIQSLDAETVRQLRALGYIQ